MQALRFASSTALVAAARDGARHMLEVRQAGRIAEKALGLS
jgi:hypothetical protein